MSNFIVREEYFGGSYLRRKNLTLGFLDQEQTKFLKENYVGNLKKNLLVKILSDAKEKKCDEFFDLNANARYELRESSESVNDLPRGVLKAPARLYFEITRKCNLHCENCFSSSYKEYSDELTQDEIFNTIENYRKIDGLEVRITGGEPTQRKGWEEIVRFSKNLGLAVSLNTNGIYNSPLVREEIASKGIDQIIVSLDGDKDSHDYLRGKGNYEKTLDSIRYFSKNTNNVRINTLLNENSMRVIPEMVDLAGELNTELCFILLRPIGRGSILADIIPSPEKLYSAVSQINEMKLRNPQLKIMTSYDVISAGANKPAPDLDLTGCASGLRGIVVSSRGRIDPCGFLAELTDEYSPGNIRDLDYSLKDAWRSSPKLTKFRNLNLEKNKSCVSCSNYKTKCFGSCVLMDAYKKVNDQSVDPYCFLDRQ